MPVLRQTVNRWWQGFRNTPPGDRYIFRSPTFDDMKTDKYPVIIGETSMVFEFVSEGVRGSIPKLVIYSDIHLHNFYNLGFGDKDAEPGEIDNEVVMKKAKNSGKKHIVIKVDKNLDKYLDKGLFKEKVDKANQVLKNVGLPKFSQ